MGSSLLARDLDGISPASVSPVVNYLSAFLAPRMIVGIKLDNGLWESLSSRHSIGVRPAGCPVAA